MPLRNKQAVFVKRISKIRSVDLEITPTTALTHKPNLLIILEQIIFACSLFYYFNYIYNCLANQSYSNDKKCTHLNMQETSKAMRLQNSKIKLNQIYGREKFSRY